MVDKLRRVEAAKLIEDFLSCRITNFEYDERYPRSDDPALFAIYSMLWFAYSDLRNHRMDGRAEQRGATSRRELYFVLKN